MSDAAALLALQDLDTRLDQLRHRRTTLPEAVEMDEVVAEIGEVERLEAVDGVELDRLGGEQRRLEDDVAAVVDKIGREQQRQSTIIVPREAEAVQAELAALGRRQAELEDRILELMEQSEPLGEASATRRRTLDELSGHRDAIAERVAARHSEIDGEIAGLVGERDDLAARVTPALVDRYEQLRQRAGGVVVGSLDGSTCTGCSLQLPPVEVERLREQPEGSVQPCECGKLMALVRR